MSQPSTHPTTTFSLRWHSRAGQGAVTAASALAEILSARGKFVQAFPEFGAEKRGAAVLVFNRIADQPFKLMEPVRYPTLAILMDTTLANSETAYQEIVAGLDPKNSALLINTAQAKTRFSEFFSGKIFHLDALKIALEEIKKPIPNVPILGAAVKILELSEENIFAAALEKYLQKDLPLEIVAGNTRAFRRGCAEAILS
jgi:pyruvate ferredoxin oxidoreductase gamma subunit